MARRPPDKDVEPVPAGDSDSAGPPPRPLDPDRPLRELSKPQLISLIEQLRAFGPVEGAVREALVGVPPGGVGAARASLALSLSRLIDEPPGTAKLSELASASKELRAVLKELDLERDDGDAPFFDGLDAPVGNTANR